MWWVIFFGIFAMMIFTVIIRAMFYYCFTRSLFSVPKGGVHDFQFHTSHLSDSVPSVRAGSVSSEEAAPTRLDPV